MPFAAKLRSFLVRSGAPGAPYETAADTNRERLFLFYFVTLI
jgi:hypothetical protein